MKDWLNAWKSLVWKQRKRKRISFLSADTKGLMKHLTFWVLPTSTARPVQANTQSVTRYPRKRRSSLIRG